jgi:hypothetical protein
MAGRARAMGATGRGAFGSFGYQHFRIDTFLLILTYVYISVYIKKIMSMKPNPKEINIILNILKGAQFEFLPRASFYIDTPLLERERDYDADLKQHSYMVPERHCFFKRKQTMEDCQYICQFTAILFWTLPVG